MAKRGHTSRICLCAARKRGGRGVGGVVMVGGRRYRGWGVIAVGLAGVEGRA